jgi:hypothetical protein
VSRKTFWIGFVAVIVLVPAAAVGYWMFPQWERIPDVTKASELVLHSRKHQNNIYGIEIHVYGEIDGEAELWLGSGEPYRALELSGTVDAHYTGDWYSDEAPLSYKPIHVTGGSLKLRYRFFPLYPTEPID